LGRGVLSVTRGQVCVAAQSCNWSEKSAGLASCENKGGLNFGGRTQAEEHV